jgi:hypothetical protein
MEKIHKILLGIVIALLIALVIVEATKKKKPNCEHFTPSNSLVLAIVALNAKNNPNGILSVSDVSSDKTKFKMVTDGKPSTVDIKNNMLTVTYSSEKHNFPVITQETTDYIFYMMVGHETDGIYYVLVNDSQLSKLQDDLKNNNIILKL